MSQGEGLKSFRKKSREYNSICFETIIPFVTDLINEKHLEILYKNDFIIDSS